MSALIISVGVVAFHEINTLAGFTRQMYDHPMTVSNAVLEADGRIIAMHRFMKDVALARNPDDLEQALTQVKAEEQRILELFEIMQRQYLGDQSEILLARDAFIGWQHIRNQVTELSRQGRYQEAADITQGKDYTYVTMLSRQMDQLIDFAQTKAWEFNQSSIEAHQQSKQHLLALLSGTLFLVLMTAMLVIRNVSRSQKDLILSQQKYQNLYDTMIQGVIYRDNEGQIISANQTARQFFNFNTNPNDGQINFHSNYQIIDEFGNTLDRQNAPSMLALKTGKPVEDMIVGVLPPTKTHQLRWLLVNATPIFNEGNSQASQVYSIYTDITDMKKSEEDLKVLSRAVESSSSAVIIADAHGDIEYVNPKFSEITGHSRQDILGKNTRIMQSGMTPDSTYKTMWHTIQSGQEWRGEIKNIRKDGSFYWARNSISGVWDAEGRLSHVIAIQDDVTSEYEINQKLTYHATHDLLTGLINRREFENRVQQALVTAQNNRNIHSMCFIDLDQFKVINDTCGHSAGDELLRQLGRVLSDHIRKNDTLARLGGDEFGLLMLDCTVEQAQRVANLLLKTIQDFQFTWEKKNFRVGASIGLVGIDKTTPDLSELLRQADAACYMAKDYGRNRVHTYHQDDSDIVTRHGEMQWATRINHALDNDQYVLYAQPIVSADKLEKHYELLIRMIDDQGDTVPPGAFLPSAERYNLIERLDTWVIDKAFALLADNRPFLDSVHFISINLSGPSLANNKMFETILQLFEKTGVPTDKICFEITETVAISNMNAAIQFISQLRDQGCLFALDDFGSGLSSFGYLKNLPVDYLKIDGMFVKDILNDQIDRAMVKSINEIGHVMGKKTIAEFVENDDIRAMLQNIGVDYFQGYGIGKPQPFEALLDQKSIGV